MRIGFDITPLSARGTGIARYTLELLRSLATLEPPVEIELISNRRLPAGLADGSLQHMAQLHSFGFSPGALWMQTSLPLALSRSRVDICHFTNYSAPLTTGIPTVVTLHDMSLLLAPQLHPRRRVLTLTPIMRLAARRARAIATPTESARQDALRLLGLDPQRVHVVGGAVAPWFQPVSDQARLSAVCDRYGIEPGFVLFVGTIEPRKNLLRLARSFARLRADGFNNRLVICGGWGWHSSDLRPAIADLLIADAVTFTGYVPEADLVGLLSAAGAFVYPSLYEGFGLPIVEAFACGAPTVTSNRGATAEVAGDAALLVDPEDDSSLHNALAAVLGDAALREGLRERGFQRARAFNHARAAEQALRTYASALGDQNTRS